MSVLLTMLITHPVIFAATISSSGSSMPRRRPCSRDGASGCSVLRSGGAPYRESEQFGWIEGIRGTSGCIRLYYIDIVI